MNSNRLSSSFAVLSLLALVSGCSGSDGNHAQNTAPVAGEKGATPGGGGASTDPGAALAATPADGYRFFLPTPAPDNTAPPMVVSDSIGATHAVYPAFAKGGAYYAFCGAGCTDKDGVKVVKFETDGTVTNASIALDAQNHPRVLLNAFHKVYYATCDASCGEQASWTVNAILDHGGKQETSGETLALDPHGNPRFLLHTYRTFGGFGQGDPETYFVSCDSNCGQPASWSKGRIQTQNLQNGNLRIDATGKVHLAAVTNIPASNGGFAQEAAYLSCPGNCLSQEGWSGIGLGQTYVSKHDAFDIGPSVTMALTKGGRPRVALLGQTDAGSREVHYLECDNDNCAEDHWAMTVLSISPKLGQGLDLALGANDEPRLAYTLDWSIALATCDKGNCVKGSDRWGVTKIEKGDDMPPDQIFLYPNCNVSAWFLMSPSVAVTPNGEVRVGYQARDASGGFGHPDTTHQDCVAGTDMAWDRITFLPLAK